MKNYYGKFTYTNKKYKISVKINCEIENYLLKLHIDEKDAKFYLMIII